MVELDFELIILRLRVEEHLIHHVNDRLSFVSTETLHRLSFTAIGEDGVDQGYTLVCREGVINQPPPRGDRNLLSVRHSEKTSV